jgi:hypothetical protein
MSKRAETRCYFKNLPAINLLWKLSLEIWFLDITLAAEALG